ENEDLRALLNSGHRRGAVAGRCVMRGSTVITEEIPSYSAVALAGLGWLPDTIMTRSVIVRMRRRAPDERIEPFRCREWRGIAPTLSWLGCHRAGGGDCGATADAGRSRGPQR